MTRASAAAATGLPSDRRSLLTGAALASLVAATAAVPATAAEAAGPIEVAYAAWRKAAREADVACEATWEAEERYEEPERPRYNHFQSQGAQDIEIVGIDEQGRRKGRSYLRIDDENVAYLKAMIEEPFDPSRSEPQSVEWDRRSHERQVEQAAVTLQTIEAHRAECKRRADACGLTAAQECEKPLTLEMHRLQSDLLSMTPSTFREAAFQAVVLSVDDDEEAVCRLVRRLADLAGIPDYAAGEA